MAGQFESFKASKLFCKKCNQAMPVREKLLLILPDKEVYDYLCTGCAASLGKREVSVGEIRLQQALQRRMMPKKQLSMPRLRA